MSGGELCEEKQNGGSNDLNQCATEDHVEQMGRAPKGDLETSNKVTSRPPERSTPPVFRWLGPACCTHAGCFCTACSLYQTGLSSAAGLFLENTQQGLVFCFGFSFFFRFLIPKVLGFCCKKRVGSRDASEGQMARMQQNERMEIRQEKNTQSCPLITGPKQWNNDGMKTRHSSGRREAEASRTCKHRLHFRISG